MAYGLAQSVLDANTSATSAAVGNDVTFASALTAGSTLTAHSVIWSSPALTIATPTATSHTFTAAESELAATDGNGKMQTFYEDNVSGGDTPTVHFSHSTGNAFHTSVIAEHSGLLTTGSLDSAADAQATSASTTTPSVTSGTMAQADNVVIGILSHLGSDRTITPGSGYTTIQESETGTNSMPISVEYVVVASTTAKAADWTIGTGAVATFQSVIPFKLAGGAPAVANIPPPGGRVVIPNPGIEAY